MNQSIISALLYENECRMYVVICINNPCFGGTRAGLSRQPRCWSLPKKTGFDAMPRCRSCFVFDLGLIALAAGSLNNIILHSTCATYKYAHLYQVPYAVVVPVPGTRTVYGGTLYGTAMYCSVPVR